MGFIKLSVLSVMEKIQWTYTCCNPFNKPGHLSKKKSLRPILPWMIEKFPSLQAGDKICDSCRKQLGQTTVEEISVDESLDDDIDNSYTCHQEQLESINECLKVIGETPVVKKKLVNTGYQKEKLSKIKDAAAKALLPSVMPSQIDDGCEIIEQLKQKFHSSIDRSQQVTILTILPKSWSVQKVQEEFRVSNYMARKVKELVKNQGILSNPNPKHGCGLPLMTVNLVKDFYELDDISRIMPGKKDFVSVRQGDKRVHLQKRLLLSNLKELYQQFKEEYPMEKIGFSKFAELRPQQCVLAGASGTHAVCVCTIHQNVKLMMIGGKIAEQSTEDDISLKEYGHCLARIICNPPQPDCYFQICSSCPGISGLKEHLHELMDSNMIEAVQYKQWISTDRSTLETITKSADEFVESFCEQLKSLLTHSFVAKQQSTFQMEVRSGLKPGVFQVIADFSENYSFILQDEAQGFHWNNSQATIHPFVVYYPELSGKLHHLTFVAISDCLNHDTVAVYLYQKCLIEFLRSHINPPPHKIFYFSDGAAAQYKNRKNFLNLCYHKTDFGIDAEWHFFATSHGKGPCDGVGGTIKRLAAKASLQRPYDKQIMTPRQLYEWASENISAMTFAYCTKDDYKHQEIFLRERFQQSRTIPGTQKLHCFIPITQNKLHAKVFSNSSTMKEERVTLSGIDELPLEDINGFITVVHNDQWWVGCVLHMDEDSKIVTVNLLYPQGPSQSFKYPSKQNIITVSSSYALTTVDPSTVTGRTYTISKQEAKAATDRLKLWKKYSL